VLIEHGGVRLLTDPVLRRRVLHLRRHPPLPVALPSVDAVLLSHLHFDHLDLPSLRALDPGTLILAPRGAGGFLLKAGLRRVEELTAGDRADVGGVIVNATPAEHDAGRRPFGPRAQPLGFISAAEHSVYFAGDTDLFAGLEELPRVDVALLPVAGWGRKLGPGHLDPARAARAAALLRPRIAVPIHWGTLYAGRRGSWFTDPPRAFAAQVAERAGGVAVRVLAPGQSFEL
jgi:L-ascorbate metabolism protein UlaG (beta-lactamase superfamily)